MRALLFMTLISTWTYGQSELSTNNPAPRQGDEIEINVTLKENGERIGKGDIKISQLITEVGHVNIGPFKFTIGDKAFETGVLTLTISPKLPDDIKDGFWIRLIEVKGEGYLIMEQRISNQWKREKKSDNETTMTHGTE